MKQDRRRFISAVVGGGAASLTLPSAGVASPALNARYAKLDGILKQPVLKKQFFTADNDDDDDGSDGNDGGASSVPQVTHKGDPTLPPKYGRRPRPSKS